MKVIDSATEIFQEIAGINGMDINSVVLYGNDLYLDTEEADDYKVLIVVEHIDLEITRKLKKALKKQKSLNLSNPLILELGEIEGMMDSVPQLFLNILVHYQTIYGKTLFKGLSAISQEHLRAHTERVLRDSLFQGRIELITGMGDKDEMVLRLEKLLDILYCSIRMFHLIKKPWLTMENEHMESFYNEFPVAKQRFGDLNREKISDIDLYALEEIGYSIILQGIRPMLDNVDNMGP
ncbi:MAG: hypothetical protein KAH57_00750 [Thermoplasmata archaeon]|nr:hypothetical protein [Thermoplasmata archaeon]